MGNPLHLLIVENSENDLLRLLHVLRQNDYAPAFRRVASAAAMREALAQESWDAIIADYEAPGFGGLAALELVQQLALDIPFLMVSDAVGDQDAVEAMKAGAHDFLTKDKLTRLAPAIRRELAEAKMRAARHQAEAQLIKLSLAVEQSPTIVYITDTEGKIEYVNPRFIQVTGYQREEVIGQNPRILKSGETPSDEYRRLWETVRAGAEWHGEFHNRKKNGDYFWVAASITPIRDAEGRITHFLALEEDITQRRQMEEALRQRTVELQARNEELDAFAHTVAHDLKSPLTMISGYAELLLAEHERLSSQEREACFAAIAESGHKINSIVTELLVLAEVRKTEVELQPLKMAEIVAEATKRLTFMIRDFAAQIELPAQWPAALGHALWVEEVWTNYISNAIKYGGRPPLVRLGAENISGRMIRFWVADNGSGLTPEQQSRLFTPFTQLQQVKLEGHGLGLSIVRRIVHKLGGEVGISSYRGDQGGSVFSFTLPRLG